MLAPGFKSYLIRAVYEYCIDHALVPMVTVSADEGGGVLAPFAKDGFVTLDLSNAAVRELTISPDNICFLARFGGKVAAIDLAIAKVAWIGSACGSCGMGFDHGASAASEKAAPAAKAPAKVVGKGSARPELRLL